MPSYKTPRAISRVVADDRSGSRRHLHAPPADHGLMSHITRDEASPLVKIQRKNVFSFSHLQSLTWLVCQAGICAFLKQKIEVQL